MFYRIYKTTNLVNGKIYIGQTHYNKDSYFGSGNLILQAIEKYGKENFVKEYIDEASDQDELDEKEKFWIKELNAQDRNFGYNIANGGWNCLTMNDVIKQKISKTLTGKYVGDMAFRKGISLSEDHKKAISKASKGRTLSEDTKRKLSESHTGKTHTKEAREKMSRAHTGKTLSDNHRKKISESGQGRVLTEEQKEKLRSSNIDKTQVHSRTISATCIKTNMELQFSNISSAARHFNVTRHRIKNNLVDGWHFIVKEPMISIEYLKKTKNGSESKNNT